MKQEFWRDIKGYEGLYKVSNYGNIIKNKTNQQMKMSFNQFGYLRISLTKNKKRKTIPVHRLVALSFIPNIKNNPCVNHINGIKHDNYIGNLEWVTYSENSIHAIKIGLKTFIKGKDNCKSVPILQYNLDGNFIKEWDSIVIACTELKISRKNISSACSGYRKSSQGFMWRYKNNNKIDIKIPTYKGQKVHNRLFDKKIIFSILSSNQKDKILSEKYNVSISCIKAIRLGYNYKKYFIEYKAQFLNIIKELK